MSRAGALRGVPLGRPASLARWRARRSSMLQIASHMSLIAAWSEGKSPLALMIFALLWKRFYKRGSLEELLHSVAAKATDISMSETQNETAKSDDVVN